ncbi:hypothetical protein BIW11_14311 [Tropilaelaps mercedesae]|uniref:Uncharacterized protein n=1 Tax=Tropilaelaps mercedesae TaxID=418985 RepID=A0A1V9WY79_9ACAR|nr:hypothetical protein BIW11_14311 [Tropilaelaps mercedesae]
MHGWGPVCGCVWRYFTFSIEALRITEEKENTETPLPRFQ